MRVEPRRTVVAITIAVLLLGGVIASFMMLDRRAPMLKQVVEAPRDAALPIDGPAMSFAVTQPPPIAVPPPPPDVWFVLTVGEQTYAVMEAKYWPPQKLGPARIVGDVTPVSVAVADIAKRDLPAELKQLRRQGMNVDGSCKAAISGFAVIARLHNEVHDPDDSAAHATEVMTSGERLLAARLEGCDGTYARAARLPELEVFTETAHELAPVARERFLASEPVMETQRDWYDTGHSGTWYEEEDARVTALVFAHPRTGVEWVVVHANLDGGPCGTSYGVLGLYRIDGDNLVDVSVRTSGLEQIDGLVDIDRDGEPELLGSSNGFQTLDRADGAIITSISVGEVYDGECHC